MKGISGICAITSAFISNQSTQDTHIFNRIDTAAPVSAVTNRARSAVHMPCGSISYCPSTAAFLPSISDQSAHPQTKLSLAEIPRDQDQEQDPDQALSLLAYSLSTPLTRGGDFLAFLKKQYSENNYFQLSLAHNCKPALVDYYETHELDAGEDHVLEINHSDLDFNLKRALDAIVSTKDFLYGNHNSKFLSTVKIRIVAREHLGVLWRSQEDISHGALLLGVIPLDSSQPLALRNKGSRECFPCQRAEAITFFNREYEYQTSSFGTRLVLEIEYDVGLALEMEEQRSPLFESRSVVPSKGW